MANAFGNARVSFRMRRLEPYVALSIAAATAWVGIFPESSGSELWLLAIYAVGVAAWSQLFPARRAMVFLARALLLLAGATVGFLLPGNGGPLGPYFFWLAVITAAYCFLLPPGWAALVLLLALMAYGSCSWVAVAAGSGHLAVMKAGLLALLAPVALLFGRSMQRSDQQVELSLTDRRTKLYNLAGLMEHGQVLLDECRRDKRPASLVLFNAKDLLKIPALIGREAGHKLFAHALRGVAAAANEGDSLAARTDATAFALVFPGATADRALKLVHQFLGDPPRAQLDLPQGKVVIVLETVVAEAGNQTLAILYERMLSQLQMPRDSTQNTTVIQAPAQPKPLLSPEPESDRFHPHVFSPTVPLPETRPADLPAPSKSKRPRDKR